jgi:hypothetical protein
MRFFVAAAIVLTGFMGIEAAKGAPTPEGKSARVSQENDIREAVFRYQFRHNSSIQGQKAGVYCLSVGEKNADPPDDFMKRFAAFKPAVQKASDCSTDPYRGVAEKRTGRRGVVFRVRSIKWVSETEVEVVGGYFEDGLSASGNTYAVIKTQGKWTVSKAKTNWIS